MKIQPDTGNNSPLKAWVRALASIAPISRDPLLILPALVEVLAERFGDSPALLSDQESLTYRSLAGRTNQYARWTLERGIAAGDVVCLMMENCPEYMAIWLGISRVGAIVALLNTNLGGQALAHALAVAAPKHVIAESKHAAALASVAPLLPPGVKYWTRGPNEFGFPSLDGDVARCANARMTDKEFAAPSLRDPALYIYTSGTTGLPKAAKVSHFRILQWSHWFAGLTDMRPSDRLYNCLPMYHSVGGIVATGAPLVAGASVVLRPRFSASRFWEEICRWDCTIFQYIGELCRYLLHSPPDPREAEHRIRLCCGNGLRPDIWERFKHRFHIPQILEFYAATESNVSLYNCEGKPGAIGRIPSFLAHRFPVTLVKFDVEAGQPERNEDGFCIRCAVNETGEALGKIVDDAAGPGGRFEGYTDRRASEAKIMRDVFEPGDAWFRTGDLMRRDEAGYFYFMDRIGDTYRWKGENVSTTEVSEAISTCPGVVEAIVYGVVVPATEGRAGMAALVVRPSFNIDTLRTLLTERLPEYARPVFLRICRNIEMTATFKPKKQELVNQGYDPTIIDDAVYLDDRAQQKFLRIDNALFERIQRGELRL